tara:strand:- start:29414 stop:30331 length:918 start_codon:yes stop_codon:yes gene_type:complete
MVLWSFLLMIKNVLVIYNPTSGIKSNKGMLHKLFNYYSLNKITYELIETKHKNHAQDFCKNNDLSHYHDIIVCGGDGTFNEVVNGLMMNKFNQIPRLGFLPGGTGNSFMHDLGSVDKTKALDKIFQDKSDFLDIIKLTYNNKTTYSFNVVGWGLVTDILILAEKMRFLKGLRYNIASLFYLLIGKGKKIRFSIDNQVFKDDYLFILICNTIHTGKGMKAAPKAKFNDGFLDVISVKSSISLYQLIKLFSQIFSGQHIYSKYVEYHIAKKIELEPANNEILNIDGDAKGFTPVNLEVLNNQLRIIN